MCNISFRIQRRDLNSDTRSDGSTPNPKGRCTQGVPDTRTPAIRATPNHSTLHSNQITIYLSNSPHSSTQHTIQYPPTTPQNRSNTTNYLYQVSIFHLPYSTQAQNAHLGPASQETARGQLARGQVARQHYNALLRTRQNRPQVAAREPDCLPRRCRSASSLPRHVRQ